jgi:multidrug efflux pump subunit AcrA (membrane-fusion protein)
MTWAALGFGEPSRVAVQEVAQSGVVESVAVAQGDWVEKGDLLAKVGSLPLEQAVSEAKAEVERVEANVDLLAVEREGLLLKARDSLKTAESKLQRSSMVAKNTGRVSGVLVKPGESLVLGQAAVEVETDFYAYNLLKLMFISVLTGLAGFSLALMISAIFSSGVAAVSTLPLLIIPQICFSAILVPLKGMGVVAKAITWVTIERYAFEATLKAGSRVDEWVVHEFNTKPSGGALFDLGFKTADVNNMGLAYSTSMMALAAFSAIFLSIAWCVIWRRDRP